MTRAERAFAAPGTVSSGPFVTRRRSQRLVDSLIAVAYASAGDLRAPQVELAQARRVVQHERQAFGRSQSLQNHQER
jgi:hypothetical protein